MSPYISEDVRARIRATAEDRCGYCRSPQHLVLGPLEIDHLVPTAAGGSDDEENLWLACRMCNNFKAAQTQAIDPPTGRRVRLFNPRKQHWSRPFHWSPDGTQIVGRTATGRATVAALQLNHVVAVLVRRTWVSAGWHPPSKER
ncbi:MAG: HNH endonuclease [Chloroflexota bacterium]